MQNSLSIVVPFYNEEKTILKVYLKIKNALKRSKIYNYELIFIDDFSFDESLKKVCNLKKKDNKIKIIKNKKNIGFANSLKIGFKNAKKNFLHFVPGDDEHPESELVKIYKQIGKYDLIIPYVINKETRSRLRLALSEFFTLFINFIFLKKIPYYNGLILYNTNVCKKYLNKINNSSFSFLSELLITILNNEKIEYKLIGYKILKSKRKTNAFKFKNIINTIYSILIFRIKTII